MRRAVRVLKYRERAFISNALRLHMSSITILETRLTAKLA